MKGWPFGATSPGPGRFRHRGSTPLRSTQPIKGDAVKISEVVFQLLKLQGEMGDLPVVMNDGLGVKVDSVFWDEDDNDTTVAVVGW